MPRFALLRHECPPGFKPSHWDFMLERDGALMTWSLAALPRSWATALAVEGDVFDTVEAVRLVDHRIAYLDYEGPVTHDRGEVWRCAGGDFQWALDAQQVIRVNLSGAVLPHVAMLRQIEGDRWQLESPG